MWPISRFAKFYGYFLMIAGVLYVIIGLATLILGRSCKTATCQMIHLLHMLLSVLTVYYGRRLYRNAHLSLPNPTMDLETQLLPLKNNMWIFTGLNSLYGISGFCPPCWPVCATFNPDVPDSLRSCPPAAIATVIFYANIQTYMLGLNLLLFGLVFQLIIEQCDGREPNVYTLLSNMVEGSVVLVRLGWVTNVLLLRTIQLRFLWVQFQVKIVLAKRRWIPVRQVASAFLQ